jgi:protein-S-isoprenylcysteine O-methyltransferase Ste14
MDPINIIVGINIIAVFGANISGAKAGFKTTITQVKEKPKTYLQTLPLTLATVSLIALIISVFQVGTLSYEPKYNYIRLVSLLVYLIFSWIQIWSFRSLGKNYSQDIVILNKHELISKGPYKIIRHPQYLSQIIIDISGAVATLSYIVLPLALIQIPLLIKRALLEEKLLIKHFMDKYESYKKKSGFIIPFIG